MAKPFLSEELYRVPIALYNSWPFIEAPWIDLATHIMPSASSTYQLLSEGDKQDCCNTILRFHMTQAKWYGRWRASLQEDWKHRLTSPPIGVPELSLVTSGTYITRALYGAFICYWNASYIILTFLFLVLLTTTSFVAITENAPIFTGYRTIDMRCVDVDKVQLSTRTVRARNLLLFLTNAPPVSFFRLTVIYTRYIRGTIVFKRKHSEQVRYTEFVDLVGRFDTSKFEEWLRKVLVNAMTVPYGSTWSLHHFTLT